MDGPCVSKVVLFLEQWYGEKAWPSDCLLEGYSVSVLSVFLLGAATGF